MMDTPGLAQPFTNKQATARKYPLQFLCDFAYSVLDDETGNLLEYRCENCWLSFKDKHRKGFKGWLVKVA